MIPEGIQQYLGPEGILARTWYGRDGVLDDHHAGRLSDPVVSVIAKSMTFNIKEEIENLLYPELRPYGRSDRDRLLRNASDTPLEPLEWAGILLGLVVAVTLTRYSAAEVGLMNRIAVGLANFVVALLLLGVTAGPFLVRRTRRGIRSQLD